MTAFIPSTQRAARLPTQPQAIAGVPPTRDSASEAVRLQALWRGHRVRNQVAAVIAQHWPAHQGIARVPEPFAHPLDGGTLMHRPMINIKTGRTSERREQTLYPPRRRSVGALNGPSAREAAHTAGALHGLVPSEFARSAGALNGPSAREAVRVAGQAGGKPNAQPPMVVPNWLLRGWIDELKSDLRHLSRAAARTPAEIATAWDQRNRCPVSLAPLLRAAVASDGHTYDLNTLIRYVDDVKPSPCTREPIYNFAARHWAAQRIVDAHAETSAARRELESDERATLLDALAVTTHGMSRLLRHPDPCLRNPVVLHHLSERNGTRRAKLRAHQRHIKDIERILRQFASDAVTMRTLVGLVAVSMPLCAYLGFGAAAAQPSISGQHGPSTTCPANGDTLLLVAHIAAIIAVALFAMIVTHVFFGGAEVRKYQKLLAGHMFVAERIGQAIVSRANVFRGIMRIAFPAIDSRGAFQRWMMSREFDISFKRATGFAWPTPPSSRSLRELSVDQIASVLELLLPGLAGLGGDAEQPVLYAHQLAWVFKNGA